MRCHFIPSYLLDHLVQLTILRARDPLALLQQIFPKLDFSFLALRFERKGIGRRRLD